VKEITTRQSLQLFGDSSLIKLRQLYNATVSQLNKLRFLRSCIIFGGAGKNKNKNLTQRWIRIQKLCIFWLQQRMAFQI
jgi:hypothetical protein